MRSICGFILLLLVCTVSGCSSDKEKGIYKDKEKPVPADAKAGKG